MRRGSAAIVGALLAMSLVHGAAPVAHAGGEAASYLALGDSLSVGYQPGRGETSKGYVDVLFRTFEQRIPGLSLENVGCAGETTRSLITGRRSLCGYPAGSQLDEAVAFLQAHPGQVAFITIDVGANDLVETCLRQTWRFDRLCAAGLFPILQARLTRVVEALQAAGPGVPIVAMTYHDPFLGLWGLVPGGRVLARANQRVWEGFNAALETAYEGAGVTVADVAATFRIDDFADTIVVPGRGPLPANVALTCLWTWFCTPRFGGDPHPNATGYRMIARTFEPVLEALLSG
jgi:lysophospholipase L1-like esterase